MGSPRLPMFKLSSRRIEKLQQFQIGMTSITFDRESFNRCNCGGCPVQRSSECVRKQEERLAEVHDRLERDSIMPDPAVMPGMYCADPVGKSSCEDLDETKSCLCPACALAIMEGLKNNYYCLKGGAREVG